MVNHHRDLSTDAVEKFIFDPKKNELNWEKSFTNPSVLRSVNDIVAIGNDQFFATNDHFFQADYPKMRLFFIIPQEGKMIVILGLLN